MITITITLSDSAAEFVESQISEGGYESAGEYFGSLVRQAQKRKAREELETSLIEGLNSSSAEHHTHELSEIQEQLLERSSRGQGK